MRSLFLIICCIVFCSNASIAQLQKPNLDSILNLSYAQLSSNMYASKQLLENAIPSAEALKDDRKLAKLYAQLGIVHLLLNKYELSVDYFLKSILLYEQNKDEIGAGNAYAELGNSMRRRDIDKAMFYMKKGIALLEKNNSESLQSAYDNYGVLFHQLGNEDSALFYYQKALNLKKEGGNFPGLPYSMQKIAMAKTAKREFEAALLILSEALAISKEVKDTLLICETYTYYGDVFVAKKDFNLAADNYEVALEIAKEKRYSYLVNYIYGALPDVYQGLGDNDKAFRYLKESQTLKDSALNLERVRSIAELEMVFETTQKEQKIQLLEQDIQISRLQTQQQRRIVAGIIILLLMISALLALIMNRQKLKHKTVVLEQKELLQKERLISVIVGEEKERERVARELHDGLGQLLSAAKMHISSLEDDVAPELQPYFQNSIQLVDQACNEVREISHALLPKKLISGHLEMALNELANTINTSNKITFKLFLNTSLSDIKNQKAVAIFRIIQELVNNTLKHAQAETIVLKVNLMHEKYCFQYADNGKHFQKSMIENGSGIGWKNIFSRVELMDGTIEIEDKNGGMKATIQFK